MMMRIEFITIVLNDINDNINNKALFFKFFKKKFVNDYYQYRRRNFKYIFNSTIFSNIEIAY